MRRRLFTIRRQFARRAAQRALHAWRASLRKRAKRLYGGNVSAVIAELASDAALLEGMHDLVERLGGPSLTDEDRDSLSREWAGRPPPSPRPARKRKAKKAA